MTPQERKVMELALEASKDLCTEFALAKVQEILTNALAQPEQEPVAWRAPNWGHGDDEWVYRDFDDPVLIADGKPSPNNEALYTTPPQRKPLTDEQINEVLDSMKLLVPSRIARAIEAAHGIKE